MIGADSDDDDSTNNEFDGRQMGWLDHEDYCDHEGDEDVEVPALPLIEETLLNAVGKITEK